MSGLVVVVAVAAAIALWFILFTLGWVGADAAKTMEFWLVVAVPLIATLYAVPKVRAYLSGEPTPD